MRKTVWRKIGIGALMALMVAVFMLGTESKVYAKETTQNVTGRLYEFEDKGAYEYSSSYSKQSLSTSGKLGTFKITGDIKSISKVNGFEAYEVQHTDVTERKDDEGIVKLSYVLGTGLVGREEKEWHITEDKGASIDGIKIDSKIQYGAIMVQTSLDGKKWVTDAIQTNIAGEKSGYDSIIYKSKGIQQVNGCFYRVIVVYRTERRGEDSKIGFITQKHYDYMKYAEVYEFYLIDSLESAGKTTDSKATPRKEIGKRIKTVKDKGFSGEEPITDKDPHFGWDIGTFYLNGFTREENTAEGETPIFVKTLGDRVTLWFRLDKDIMALNGNSKLSINEDTNGYDQYFGVPKTNFKHGTLIIKFTDYEGKPHDSVIYTDYLAACATTGADTKVELFEEGDYEVALDYEIKNDAVVDSYTNYRIYFKFKIRNGNCMVFPFDVKSGAELSDNALTENGFKLDLAKSRYLTIDIVRNAVKKNNGRYYLDTRVNAPTKDGKAYTDEGVYTITVNNPTTKQETEKIIYVGTSAIYKAMAGGKSIDDINELLDQGGILQDDGSILIPVVEPTEEPKPEVTQEPTEDSKGDNNKTVQNNSATSNPDKAQGDAAVKKDTIKTDEPTKANTKSKSPVVVIFVVIGLVVAAAVVAVVLLLEKKKKSITVKDDGTNEYGDEEDRQ